MNRNILDAFEKEGIQIALPSFTTRSKDRLGLAVAPLKDYSVAA